MIIGTPQRANRGTCTSRCVVTLLAVVAMGFAARAQQTPVQPAAASATPTTPGPAPSMSPAASPHQPGHPPLPGQMITRPPSTTSSLTQPKDNVLQAEAPGPGHEGIKVHGHWKITVHNPDGKFVKEVEFENSLKKPGAADAVLSQMLAGQFALSGFAIAVISPTGGLCDYYGAPTSCSIVPGTTIDLSTQVQFYWCFDSGTGNYQYCFPGLQQTYVPYNVTTNAASYFQLTGSVTALNSASIALVGTSITGCQTTAFSTLSNATCNLVANAGTWPAGTSSETVAFTETVLPTPLTVVVGQVVTIVVTISFS